MASARECPTGSIELLVRDFAVTSTGDDFAGWAVQALIEGFDSPALRRLAGLSVGASASVFEAKPLFDRAVRELGLALPQTRDATLRAYLQIVARHVVDGVTAPAEALEIIHREVISPLNHPRDLMPWCYLWEGIEPDTFASLDDQTIAAATRELARNLAADLKVPAAVMSNNGERFEFRFRWNGAEHRRLHRAINREVRRSSKIQRLLWGWLWLVLAFLVLAVLVARDHESRTQRLLVLTPLAVFMTVMRWGAPYASARSYRRDHAACIPNDQVRILTTDGIEARCTSSSAAVRWSAISKVRETPDFFLFFTTPSCAIELPKRAVADVSAVRDWLTTRMAVHGERMQP